MKATTEAATSIDKDALTAPAKLVEPYVDRWLDERSLPGNLREAVRYSLLGPGKRMRPIVVIRSCEAVGGKAEQALAPAAAIEMIHAFSLVHDDLPAMDDDDLRRGRPTLHRHTNEAMAVLAGDAMMALAVELLTTRVSDATLAHRLVHELVVGTNDMIAGQVYDTLSEFEDSTPEMEKLHTIHRNKTGALIRASCRMGGLCGGAEEAALEALTVYADAIGLMFQVVDDLLDVTQSTEHLGKTAGKDVDQQKLTYPALMGIDESRAEVERLRTRAHEVLADFGDHAKPLHELCDYLAVRTK